MLVRFITPRKADDSDDKHDYEDDPDDDLLEDEQANMFDGYD